MFFGVSVCFVCFLWDLQKYHKTCFKIYMLYVFPGSFLFCSFVRGGIGFFWCSWERRGKELEGRGISFFCLICVLFFIIKLLNLVFFLSNGVCCSCSWFLKIFYDLFLGVLCWLIVFFFQCIVFSSSDDFVSLFGGLWCFWGC